MHVSEVPMKNVRPTPVAGRETDAYLRRLGERVRVLRNQRGMTRKALAQHAKVSERYLAQLEAGLGNGSIILLRRIARAIGLPVTQLVQEGADPALDMVLLSQFLERLPPAALAEARNMLLKAFSSPSEDTRRKRIALIGLRGGGFLGYMLGVYVACEIFDMGNLCGLMGVFIAGPLGGIGGALAGWRIARKR